MCLPPTGRSERGGLVRAAGVAGLLCLLAACEVAAPEAHELFWKRVVFADLRQGRTYETLTLFARVSDADGLDDLDALYVMNDDAQLFWRLTPEVWVVDRSDSGTWIGSTALAMPSDEPLPAGVYRVIVQDIAGQTAEESFRVTGSTGPEARRHVEAIDVAVDANELTVTWPSTSTGCPPSASIWSPRSRKACLPTSCCCTCTPSRLTTAAATSAARTPGNATEALPDFSTAISRTGCRRTESNC